jgi:hypothetical protein
LTSPTRDIGGQRTVPHFTYKALPLNNPIFDPKAIATHQIRHHDIREQSITHNSNLRRGRDAGVGLFLEVRQHLVLAARLLGRMLEDFYTCVLFEGGCLGLVFVVVCSGCVGDYEELGAWVGASELLELFLHRLSAGDISQVIGRAVLIE